MTEVLGFDRLEAEGVARSGGKGANLSRLSRAGFPVPPGFVVTAAGYRTFIESATWLAEAVSGLTFDDPKALREACAEIRARLERIELPDSLATSIAEHVGELLASGPVAVRSSSTMEDLAGAAFAGQHDTYLQVVTPDDVLLRVRRCFCSLWEDRAVQYRQERGFDHLSSSMAVVVQSMVDADVAGVVFTINPIDGSLDEVVINASWGLGETVVSGEGDVDQFVIGKKDPARIDRHIAKKTNAVVGTAAGPKLVALHGSLSRAPCLTDEQIARVSDLAQSVEMHYGFPQDIEWAIAKDELLLLQSRPVTRFPARWTRKESAERFPNPITPLTWDFVMEGFHASLDHSLELMGLPPFEGRWFDRFDGYVYGNDTAVEIYTSGRQFEFRSVDELREMLPAIRERYLWAVQLPVTWARDLDRYLLSIGRLSAVDYPRLSDREVWNHLCKVHEVGREYFLPNIAISITQGLLHRMLHRFVTLVVGPEPAASVYDGLTCYAETKTSLVNQELEELASIARESETLRRMLADEDRRAIWERDMLLDHPRFAHRLARFLHDHGHRETDFDAYHPTWIGQPWTVLEHVRLLAGEEGVDYREREIELRSRQQEAERRFLAMVPDDLRYFATELTRLARAYTALDDLEHYQTTRLSIPFRQTAIELGRRLLREGVLDEASEVFFLPRVSLEQWADGAGSAGLRDVAAKNREAFADASAHQPSWTLGGEDEVDETGDFLQGLPGSPGVVEGEVYIVRNADDFGGFPKGAVLVARTTNPAWTPLFHRASGVITESGGPLSHGAVTAREVGVPAVMAVRRVMEVLANGDVVRVDGSRGRVSKTGGSSDENGRP